MSLKIDSSSKNGVASMAVILTTLPLRSLCQALKIISDNKVIKKANMNMRETLQKHVEGHKQLEKIHDARRRALDNLQK